LKYVRDTTGRFAQRPHYEPGELDNECEGIITQFMRERYAGLCFPIPTEALTLLIERDAADLDLYADLSGEGDDVEGVTEFIPNQKPKVRISKELTEQEHREHRLRTTLAHEYGHVKFHGYLFDMEHGAPSVFSGSTRAVATKCKRETILNASQYDWMEWQAGYVCGALLMPISAVKQDVVEFRKENRFQGNVVFGTPESAEIIRKMAAKYDVSRDAGKVRLLKLNYLVNPTGTKPLFR
jgi:hypothetical protein